MITNRLLQASFESIFAETVKNVKLNIEELTKLSENVGKPIVYIAGKVTGLEAAHVHAKFNKRKAELIEAGYIVINPCDYIKSTENWFVAMAICFVLLPYAKYISLLHDWQDSKGAMMEKELADKLGIELLTLSNQ
jgi:Domain of unknown function (DUF4406)